MKVLTSRVTALGAAFGLLAFVGATLFVLPDLVAAESAKPVVPAQGGPVRPVAGEAPSTTHPASPASGKPASPGTLGYASWYGPSFQGRLTASGEVFDTNELTAAHKSLPFNSIVKITNLSNGKSVIVRINDRGPYVRGRMIDLTHTAAVAIGMIGDGVVKVRMDVLHRQQPSNLRNLQIAAFTDRNDAVALQDSLKAEGLDPEVQRNGNGAFRVVLMGIPEENLPPLQSRLRELGYTNTLVRIS